MTKIVFFKVSKNLKQIRTQRETLIRNDGYSYQDCIFKRFSSYLFEFLILWVLTNANFTKNKK